MYPLCMIFGPSGSGKALYLKKTLKKIGVFTTWLGNVVHLQQKVQFLSDARVKGNKSNGLRNSSQPDYL
ncbi:hypothetical protein TNCV_2765871 [Trichonephila clavipes]|nr:hypothetical protein TNCV_2765871 [Trichonephila clavipes]